MSVKGARIYVRQEVNFGRHPCYVKSVIADTEGSARFRVPTGKCSISAGSRNYNYYRSAEPIPELKELKIDLSLANVSDKMLLVCFWDMNQRPSRNCIMRLDKQAEQLKQRGVTVVVIQASKIDENKLNEWVKKYHVPFPVGMVKGDVEKTRFAWDVRSLPWLILTDRKHIVRELFKCLDIVWPRTLTEP